MILFLVSFVAGILTVLAPCILPLLPVIVGGSIGGGRSLRRAATVTASLAGSVIIFTLLIKASTLFINIPQEFWRWFSGGIIIVFGAVTLFPSLWERQPFLARLSIGSNKLLSSGYQRQNFTGDVVVGAALGPVFSTCSPTYFLVLAAVLPENLGLGILYLVAYAAGLSLALLCVAIIGQKLIDKAGVAADPRGWFKKMLGLLFLIVGLAIISGADKTLQVRILDAGFFDVTKLEQKLLELVPSESQSDGVRSMEAEGSLVVEEMSLAEKAQRFPLAPEISSPDGFVNTNGKPITLEELRGKVVLLDIWTYSCINCQRTLPYLNDWYTTYKEQGLEIVGLHTPEFAFERVLGNVERAVQEFGITYPVVLDNDYSTWNAYGNRYWPRKYLIDIDGYVIYDHIGEGGYKETEEAIQKALAERGARLGTSPRFSIVGAVPEGATNVEFGRVGSPEVYFGSSRNQYLSNGSAGASGTQTLSVPTRVELNHLYLGGVWNITEAFAENEGPARIVFPFSAKNVYFVGGSEGAVTLRVYQDNVFVTEVLVDREGLYPLVENNDYGEHVLRIEIKNAGLQAFTFTFG
jgi:cytochrome c biogenesis protein CcdA/thiol-disulfide isomerase/thioredoxin